MMGKSNTLLRLAVMVTVGSLLISSEGWSAPQDIQVEEERPTTPVYDLVIHPRDHEIVIGTHGRSIFVADVSSIRELAKTGRYRH